MTNNVHLSAFETYLISFIFHKKDDVVGSDHVVLIAKIEKGLLQSMRSNVIRLDSARFEGDK